MPWIAPKCTVLKHFWNKAAAFRFVLCGILCATYLLTVFNIATAGIAKTVPFKWFLGWRCGPGRLYLRLWDRSQYKQPFTWMYSILEWVEGYVRHLLTTHGVFLWYLSAEVLEEFVMLPRPSIDPLDFNASPAAVVLPLKWTDSSATTFLTGR